MSTALISYSCSFFLVISVYITWLQELYASTAISHLMSITMLRQIYITYHSANITNLTWKKAKPYMHENACDINE